MLADMLMKQMGIDPEQLKEQAHAVMQALVEAKNCMVRQEQILRAIAAELKVDLSEIDKTEKGENNGQ